MSYNAIVEQLPDDVCLLINGRQVVNIDIGDLLNIYWHRIGILDCKVSN